MNFTSGNSFFITFQNFFTIFDSRDNAEVIVKSQWRKFQNSALIQVIWNDVIHISLAGKIVKLIALNHWKRVQNAVLWTIEIQFQA